MNPNEFLHVARVRLLPCFLGISLAAMMPGCASSPVDRVITLDEGPASARRSTMMQEDARLTVRLRTTAGSIHAWRLIDEAGSNLTLVYRVTENDSATNHLHGDRRAWDVFAFVANKPGHARLRFAYDRPWDTKSPPLKEFALDVEVAE